MTQQTRYLLLLRSVVLNNPWSTRAPITLWTDEKKYSTYLDHGQLVGDWSLVVSHVVNKRPAESSYVTEMTFLASNIRSCCLYEQYFTSVCFCNSLYWCCTNGAFRDGWKIWISFFRLIRPIRSQIFSPGENIKPRAGTLARLFLTLMKWLMMRSDVNAASSDNEVGRGGCITVWSD